MQQRKSAARDIAKTISARGVRYGKFIECARIARSIKRAFVDSPNWSELGDDQAEALEMIALKIARVLNGDPSDADSWHDICGYAKLVADRLETGALQ